VGTRSRAVGEGYAVSAPSALGPVHPIAAHTVQHVELLKIPLFIIAPEPVAAADRLCIILPCALECESPAMHEVTLRISFDRITLRQRTRSHGRGVCGRRACSALCPNTSGGGNAMLNGCIPLISQLARSLFQEPNVGVRADEN
jgi:hypothetical protein